MYPLILTSSSLIGREVRTTKKTSSIELSKGGSSKVLHKEGIVEGGMVCWKIPDKGQFKVTKKRKPYTPETVSSAPYL